MACCWADGRRLSPPSRIDIVRLFVGLSVPIHASIHAGHALSSAALRRAGEASEEMESKERKEEKKAKKPLFSKYFQNVFPQLKLSMLGGPAGGGRRPSTKESTLPPRLGPVIQKWDPHIAIKAINL
jgi:hypothetical protein